MVWVARAVVGALAGMFLAGLLAFANSAAPARSDGAVSATSFVVESEIYQSLSGAGSTAACSGSAAILAPGVTRCLVYRVHNRIAQPITVQEITMKLDPSFPAPPSGCSAEKLSLPSYSGSFTVAAAGTAQSPGLPIHLTSTTANQDDCKVSVLHFVFTGTAVYDGSNIAPGADLAFIGSHGGESTLLAVGALLGAGLVLILGRRRRNRVKS